MTVYHYVIFIAALVGIPLLITYIQRLYRANRPIVKGGRWHCTACGQFIVFGGLKRSGRKYCSADCQQQVDPVDFCSTCLADTTVPSSPLNLHTYNGCGNRIHKVIAKPPCGVCGSRLCRIGRHFLGIWLGSGDTYRVIFLSGNTANGKVLIRRVSTKSGAPIGDN